MISRQTKFNLTLPTVACATLLLAACDSASTVVGGAAGDDDDADDSLAAIALLAPFVGIYDLQDDWNGINGDEAFLVIEIPGSDGTAPAAFYDFDDFSNCVPQRPSEGVVRKDLLSDRIFMDDILQFDQAELFLDGTTLTIEFNDDADFDRVSVTASSEAGFSLVSDLGVTC